MTYVRRKLVTEKFTITEITPSEFRELIKEAVKEVLLEQKTNEVIVDDKPFIKGIHGLAKYLDISPSRAQALKNDGFIPFVQFDKTVLFDKVEVHKALKKE